MRTMAFAMLLSGLVGCRHVYPGDGTPVGVLLDRNLADTAMGGKLEGSTMGQLAEEGMRYWSWAGVGFRIAQPGEAFDGGIIHVGFGDAGGDANADYVWACGCINISPDVALWHSADGVRTLFAHELGHAIGLEHVDGEGVMYATSLSEKSLKWDDVMEYQRVWGRR